MVHRRLCPLLQPKAGLSGRKPPECHLDAPVRHELHVLGLQGQLQAGGPAPGLRHTDQQLLSPLLILPVALGEDPWMGEVLITAAGSSPGGAAGSGGARPLRTAQWAQGWGEDPRVTHEEPGPGLRLWPQKLTNGSLFILVREHQHLLQAVRVLLLFGQLLQDLAAGQGCRDAVLALGTPREPP